MHQGYKRIFWGIFFSTFHINIGIVQILPVFVGFLIILSGIKSVLEEYDCGNLHKAAKIAAFTAVISLMGSIMELALIDSFQYPSIVVFWTALISVMELMLFYFLLTGSVELLSHYHLKEMAESYIGKTRTYLIFFSLIIIVEIIGATFNLQSLVIIFAIAAIAVRISLMVMVNALKNAEYPEDKEAICQIEC